MGYTHFRNNPSASRADFLRSRSLKMQITPLYQLTLTDDEPQRMMQ
jgi:hypothetical protein